MIPGIEVKIGADTSGLDAGVAKAGAALDRLEASADQTAATIGRGMTSGVTRAGAAMSAGGQNARMFAMQLSQVAQQTSATGNFIQALAIQIPDMTLGFGAAGIAAGILASVALPALATALMGAGEEAKTLKDQVDTLTESTDAFVAASEQSLASAVEMAEKYGHLAGVMRDVSAAMADLARADAVAELNAAMASIGATLDATRYQIQDAMGQLTGEFDWAGMAEDVGVAENAIASLVVAFDRMSAAQGPEAQARAAADLAAQLLKAFGHVDAMPGPMREVYRAALQVADEAAKIAGETERAADAAKALAPAVMAAYRAYYKARVEASRMADETARAASERAAFLASATAERIGDDERGSQREGRRDIAELRTRQRLEQLGIRPDGSRIPARGGGGGGGGGPSLADRLESLRDDLATEQETIAAWYAENMQTLDDALAARALKEQEYRDLREKLEKEHEDRLRGIRGAGQQSALATVLSTGQDILNAIGQTNQKALRAAQAFGAGIALINAYQAASEALKDPRLPWFARIAAAGQVLAAGIGFVNAIKGVNASASGVTSGAGRGAGAAQSVQGPGQTISISYDGPDFARQPIEAVVGQLNDFIKRGGRIDGVMMA